MFLVLGVVLPWLQSSARADSPPLDADDPLHARAAWDEATLNTDHAAVVVDAPSDRAITVRAESRLRFGNADHAWTTEARTVAAGASGTLEVGVPAAAFLHGVDP